jgi:hypothetical protein
MIIASNMEQTGKIALSFAKTLAGCEVNNIGAAVPPAFCYNSWPCFDSSAYSSERWFASFACDKVCSSRILYYANNLPC